MVDQVVRDPETLATIDDFYNDLQHRTIVLDSESSFRYITSRSTDQNCKDIQRLCTLMEELCQIYYIPTNGAFLRKTELSVKAFIYLVCNTSFTSQYLLADDTSIGYLVDIQPPFSPYLLIEILWKIRFEDLLAESILHFPLDLCNEILEVLPRCIDLLDFQRASKFLAVIIPNIYKKLIILRESGSQTKDIVANSKVLSTNLQELLLQFNNSRFLKLDDVPKKLDRYKRYGVLLKIIIQTVRICLAIESKTVEVPKEMEKMYKITFGWQLNEKLEDAVLQELLQEINRELINTLTKRVKEVDCNVYMSWMEFNDDTNNSLTLQRAIGLETYYFLEKTKEYKDGKIEEYNELFECLQQIVSKPDPEDSIESMSIADLCHGAKEGNSECLVALFHRYKEWDDSAIDSVDSNLSILKKQDCEKVLEHLANEISQPQDYVEDVEKLQTFSLCVAKALIAQNVTDLYEITIKSILALDDKDSGENIVDPSNFEKFIMHNSSFSSARNLKVLLFFLCLNTRPTLKILLKMSIGHKDYPNVAVSHDDLILLMPILKIKTFDKNESLVESLNAKCTEKEKGSRFLNELRYLHKKKLNQYKEKDRGVTLAVQVLQDICINEPKWDPNHFAWVLQILYMFCSPSEIVSEIFIPLLQLVPEKYDTMIFRYFLWELYKLKGGYEMDIRNELIRELEIKVDYIYKTDSICRYRKEELLLVATAVLQHLLCEVSPDSPYDPLDSKYLYTLHPHLVSSENDDETPLLEYKITLIESISRFAELHESKITVPCTTPVKLLNEDILRFIFLKCTKNMYIQFCNELCDSNDEVISGCSNKSEFCDKIIQMTFETGLFCIEYPECTAPDSFVLLINCLKEFLPKVQIAKKAELQEDMCRSLDKHVVILKETVAHTAIDAAYRRLIIDLNNNELHLTHKLQALLKFGSSCRNYANDLRVFEGPHSPLAIKLWLAHDIITEVLDESTNSEVYVTKIEKYFQEQQQN